MANTLSDFVTDADVAAYVADIKTVDASNMAQYRTAQGIDALFKNELKRPIVSATYTELLDIQREQSWHGQITRPVAILRLSHYPVTSFTSLEQVDSFDTDGSVLSTSTIAKSEYQVDLEAGLVRLVGQIPNADVMAQVMGGNSLWSFPAGVASMRVIYVAGFTAETMPNDLKLAWLIEFSKYWTMRRTDKWAESSVETGDVGGTLQLVRAKFSPETVAILRSFGKKPILSARGPY